MRCAYPILDIYSVGFVCSVLTLSVISILLGVRCMCLICDMNSLGCAVYLHYLRYLLCGVCGVFTLSVISILYLPYLIYLLCEMCSIFSLSGIFTLWWCCMGCAVYLPYLRYLLCGGAVY